MAKKETTELAKYEGRTLPAMWDMEKMFEDFFRRPFSFATGFPSIRLPEELVVVPSVDVFEENGDIVLRAELPGMKKEDIDVTLTGDTITLSGEKKKEDEVKKKDYYRWECSYGCFSRTFTLPAEVQADKVATKFKDGVLEVRMPKTEEARKKEVKVKIQ